MRLVKELSPTELRRRYFKSMLDTAKYWVDEQGLILPDIEYVVHEAGRRL